MDYQLRQQIGQMIFAGVPVADEVDDQTYHLIRAYDIANFCLFGHNIVSIPQTCALCNELAELCAGCNGVMPLIIADQEGGAVSRAKMEGAHFPGAMALAAAYDHKENGAEIANSIGHLGGLVIKALGINTNDAPVLDVNINPSNPIIGTRSFSDDPRVVSKFGIAQLKGMKEAGVLSVVKHYPGHGGVSTDSHLNLPENKATRETLAQTEWKPFKEAFEAGAEALMTCHVRFPNIDPDMPATLSPKIMTQLLRVEHRFRGLAITDCLEMDAIRSKWSPGEAAILAVEAGCDMLTFSHSFEGPMEAAKALFDAVTSGRIPRRRIEASVRRIMAAKERYRLLRHRPKDPEVAKKFAENQDMIQFFGNVSFLSITLLPGPDAGKLFYESDAPKFFAPVSAAMTGAEDPPAKPLSLAKEAIALWNGCLGVETPIYSQEKSAVALDEHILSEIKAQDYNLAVLALCNAQFRPGQQELLRALEASDRPLIVLLMGSPYDASLVKRKDVPIIAAYEYTPLSVNALLRAMDEGRYLGRCPVKVELNR